MLNALAASPDIARASSGAPAPASAAVESHRRSSSANLPFPESYDENYVFKPQAGAITSRPHTSYGRPLLPEGPYIPASRPRTSVSPRPMKLGVSPRGYLVAQSAARDAGSEPESAHAEADVCFNQIDRRSTGAISAGALLCQLEERKVPLEVLPSLFYRMARSGAGEEISRDDWRAGYPRWVKRAHMALTALNTAPDTKPGPTPPANLPSYDEEQLESFESRAQALIGPKFAQLQRAWAAFDRDGRGEVNLTWFNALHTVNTRTAGRTAPKTPAVPRLYPPVKLNFDTFRSILARQDSALLGGGEKGKGGKKGKGKK